MGAQKGPFCILRTTYFSQQSLIALQEKAIETLKDCLSSSNDMVRLKTALSVLDKASAIKKGPTSTQSIRHMEVSFDPKDVYKKSNRTDLLNIEHKSVREANLSLNLVA